MIKYYGIVEIVVRFCPGDHRAYQTISLVGKAVGHHQEYRGSLITFVQLYDKLSMQHLRGELGPRLVARRVVVSVVVRPLPPLSSPIRGALVVSCRRRRRRPLGRVLNSTLQRQN
jgi:hypothetical protein